MSYCPGHAYWRHSWAEADQLKVTMEGWPIRIQGGCALGMFRPSLLFQQPNLTTRQLTLCLVLPTPRIQTEEGFNQYRFNCSQTQNLHITMKNFVKPLHY